MPQSPRHAIISGDHGLALAIALVNHRRIEKNL